MKIINVRQVLSISLSKEKKQEIEKRAKKAKKTVSGYILDLLEIEKDLMSETELATMAEAATKDYAKGNVKKLESLADLSTSNES